ncbi:MAG: DUF29 domain-containing protein [Janthinobacterium lividum]
MPDGLYERDALAWAEQQATLLDRLAAGERTNEAVDWAHVIEEVRDVGLSELRACQSLLRQALVHLLKLHQASGDQAVNHWRGELVGFLADAQARFTPSMRQRLDLEALYRRAVRQVEAGESGIPPALPASCPFELEDLLVEGPDLLGLLARLDGG